MLLFTLLVLSATFIFLVFRRKSRTSKLPPGPPRYPIVGNLFSIPNKYEWVEYKRWADLYNSDVVCASMFGSHIIIVNTAKAARELFDRRSSLYSDRPALNAFKDLLKADWVMGFLRYGSWWREHRKAFHHAFHPNSVQKYRDKELYAVNLLLGDILHSPQHISEHLRTMTARFILDVAYGVKVKDVDDPYVVNAEKFLEGINFTSTSRGLLHDFVPSLSKLPSWFPGGSFNKSVRQWVPYGQKMMDLPFEQAKYDLENGKENHSFATSLLSQIGLNPTEHDLTFAKTLPVNMYLAGSDTTLSAMRSFVRAMALHPQIQKRARMEIEGVTKGERLPSFEDKLEMPYLDALVSEVLRWQPVTPLAIPHVLIEDDYYNDFFMPKGSTVLGNVWAILHDDKSYPDPSSFNPDRFMGQTPNLDPEFAFGFGRRMCPGRFLARESLWITLVSILACFEISKAKDEDGTEVEVDMGQTSGITSHPVSFRCSIRPRNESTILLIRGLETNEVLSQII